MKCFESDEKDNKVQKTPLGDFINRQYKYTAAYNSSSGKKKSLFSDN